MFIVVQHTKLLFQFNRTHYVMFICITFLYTCIQDINRESTFAYPQCKTSDEEKSALCPELIKYHLHGTRKGKQSEHKMTSFCHYVIC